MKVTKKIKETSLFVNALKSSNKTVGLVPTMGALHQGHLSLIEKSKLENDVSVVSIFVNPTQFEKEEDLVNYPKTIVKDLELLKKVACDFVFVPDVKTIYNDKIASENFFFEGLENQMEGKYRNNHFNGVATIVKKLFQIVQPTHAYFGEKDFQQLQIVKKLTEQEKLPVVIKAVPTLREKDGLAMSSRNSRLTKKQKEAASFIYKKLQEAKVKFLKSSITEIHNWMNSEFENHPLLKLEYFEIADEQTLQTASEKKTNSNYRAFIAVFADSVRLIDNIALQNIQTLQLKN